MEQVIDEPEVRADLVEALRELAGRPPHYSKERDRPAGDAGKDHHLQATDHRS